jgi:hypothetical protein
MMTPKKRSGNYCGFSIGKRHEAHRRLARVAQLAPVLWSDFRAPELSLPPGYPSKPRVSVALRIRAVKREQNNRDVIIAFGGRASIVSGMNAGASILPECVAQHGRTLSPAAPDTPSRT